MASDTKSKADFVAAFSKEFLARQQFSSPYRIVPDAKIAGRLVKLCAHKEYNTPPFGQFNPDHPALHLTGANIAGVDFDKCFDPTTCRMKKWAAPFILKYFGKTAHEFSYSRTGCHFFFDLEEGIPAERITTATPEGAAEIGHIDLFVNTGWLALTGIPLMNSPHPELLRLDRANFEALKRELQESGRFVQSPAPGTELPDRIKEGGRNDTLHKLGCSLRGRNHSESEITALLLAANKERCSPALPDSEVKSIAASCAKLTPGAAKVEAKPKRKLFLNVGSMATVENKQLKWLKRHIILAAALNLLVGDPDVGKTLVAIFYIAELSRAGKKIIISCREDDYSSMWKPRLVAAGANLENILPVFGVGVEGNDEEIPWMLDDDRHLELLEQKVIEHKAELCYIDPLADFAGSLNLNVSGDVRKITGALAGIAKRTSAAVLVASHTTKALVDSGIKTASGSFQLMAAVQSSWLLLEDSDVKGQRLMLQGRNKSGKKRGFKYCVESRPWPSAECGPEDLAPNETSDGVGLVVFKGATDKDASDILQRKLEKGASEIGRVRQWLTTFLANGPVSQQTCWKAAREAMGFSTDAVNKGCSQLHVVRNLKTWTLPDEHEKQPPTEGDVALFDPETFPEEELCKK